MFARLVNYIKAKLEHRKGDRMRARFGPPESFGNLGEVNRILNKVVNQQSGVADLDEKRKRNARNSS